MSPSFLIAVCCVSHGVGVGNKTIKGLFVFYAVRQGPTGASSRLPLIGKEAGTREIVGYFTHLRWGSAHCSRFGELATPHF